MIGCYSVEHRACLLEYDTDDRWPCHRVNGYTVQRDLNGGDAANPIRPGAAYEKLRPVLRHSRMMAFRPAISAVGRPPGGCSH